MYTTHTQTTTLRCKRVYPRSRRANTLIFFQLHTRASALEIRTKCYAHQPMVVAGWLVGVSVWIVEVAVLSLSRKPHRRPYGRVYMWYACAQTHEQDANITYRVYTQFYIVVLVHSQWNHWGRINTPPACSSQPSGKESAERMGVPPQYQTTPYVSRDNQDK